MKYEMSTNNPTTDGGVWVDAIQAEHDKYNNGLYGNAHNTRIISTTAPATHVINPSDLNIVLVGATVANVILHLPDLTTESPLLGHEFRIFATACTGATGVTVTTPGGTTSFSVPLASAAATSITNVGNETGSPPANTMFRYLKLQVVPDTDTPVTVPYQYTAVEWNRNKT